MTEASPEGARSAWVIRDYQFDNLRWIIRVPLPNRKEDFNTTYRTLTINGGLNGRLQGVCVYVPL